MSSAQSYPNNYFLPGAGYYHAPFHAWFPFPYNQYDSGRGWFRGGAWRAGAVEDPSEFGSAVRGTSAGANGALRLAESHPSAEAVTRANSAAATHFSSTSRGGFGHSARPGHS